MVAYTAWGFIIISVLIIFMDYIDKGHPQN